jgi:hypothetical protein
MSHPLVLALFDSPSAAAVGARALHEMGVDREHISVVARNHDEAGALAAQMDATPGADLEDSRAAARLGELGGQVLAVIALVLPGIGPIVAAGPMSAELGEVAGHVAGSLASVLKSAGVPEDRAVRFQREVQAGRVLIGVHARDGNAELVRDALSAAGATTIETATWTGAP